MKADLHIHTHHSGDNEQKLEEIFKAAKRLGLGAIGVTDHNTLKGGMEAKASAPPELIAVDLERAEPAERWPLAADPPGRLVDGEAQAYTIDHVGDRDRFVFDMPAEGTVTLSVSGPLETHVRVYDDRTGELLHLAGAHAPVRWSRPFEVKGPTRLRIELSEWGENGISTQPQFVMADTRGRAIQADAIGARADAVSPEAVTFERSRIDYVAAPASCEVWTGTGGGTCAWRGPGPDRGASPARACSGSRRAAPVAGGGTGRPPAASAARRPRLSR